MLVLHPKSGMDATRRRNRRGESYKDAVVKEEINVLEQRLSGFQDIA